MDFGSKLEAMVLFHNHGVFVSCARDTTGKWLGKITHTPFSHIELSAGSFETTLQGLEDRLADHLYPRHEIVKTDTLLNRVKEIRRHWLNDEPVIKFELDFIPVTGTSTYQMTVAAKSANHSYKIVQLCNSIPAGWWYVGLHNRPAS